METRFQESCHQSYRNWSVHPSRCIPRHSTRSECRNRRERQDKSTIVVTVSVLFIERRLLFEEVGRTDLVMILIVCSGIMLA